MHSALRARGEHEAAAQTARIFFALLSLAIAVLVLLGVLAAPLLVNLVAPGFEGAKRELAVRLVRILFPGAGILVASAWCLGVLNSHGRFLLAYTAPVAWNAAMIGTLLLFGGRQDLDSLAISLAWGSVVGSGLQFAVQARQAWQLTRHDLELGITPHVRQVVRNFMPVLVSRGAVQLTGYIDTMIASLLPTGAVTGLTNAQILYTLPVSLFGIAISASELPAMSGDAALDSAPGGRYDALARRIDAALQRMAFFVIPSAVAFAALGDVIAGVLLQTGRFTATDSRYVWGILAGSSIGLLATTMARLYSVAHYAVGDTKSPLRFAVAPAGHRDGARLSVRDRAAAVPADRAALGRRRADGLGRRGRLDRVPAAAREPQSSCRHQRGSKRPTQRVSGQRRSWREPWRSRSGARSRRSTRSSPAVSCCRCTVRCISEARR